MSAYGNVNTDFKTFNMSRLGVEKPQDERVEKGRLSGAITDENIHLLQRCHHYWDAMYSFRERRRRARMYHRGDQWKDLIHDPNDGTWQTEEDYIKKQGKQPLKQNQIRQLVKNIVGQFLVDTNKVAVISRDRNDATAGEMLTNTLQYVLDLNQSRRIDTRAFEEFLLSGAMMQKSRYRYMPKYGREDAFIENRPTAQMFVNDNIKDPRLTDMDLVGEFYDLPITSVKSAFAKNEADEQLIEQIYSQVIPREQATVGVDPMFTPLNTDNADFYNPIEPHLCRVYEVWQKLIEKRLRCHDWLEGRRFTATLDQKDRIDQINATRIQAALEQGVPADQVPLITYKERIEEFWHVKFLAPHGYLLYESETVYAHKEHPYTLLLYPLIDGEVWGFVEDVIDQQRYVNRLIMLMDFIIGASAKGVLLVPEEAIPDDMDIDDIAEEWTKFNGVIKLKLKHGTQIPKQISSSASVPGVNELLALQLKFMEEISGVNPAIQGQRAPSGTPAKLYAQETANASLNTKDYFETFNFAMRERNWKTLKIIIQFYDEERKIALAGANYSEEAMVYDPEKAQNAEVDVVMTQSADSPVYRGIIEDSLQQFVANGLIDIELYLQNSTLPFADKLLTDIQSRKQAMIDQGAMSPEMMAGVGQELQAQGANAAAADPAAMQMLQRYMSGASA